jgi:hypothetical protein
MSRKVKAIVTVIALMLRYSNVDAASCDVPVVGKVFLPRGTWESFEKGSRPEAQWVILRNVSSGDLLSFVVFARSGKTVGNPVYFFSTAHETLPDGRYYESLSATEKREINDRTTVFLRKNITSLDTVKDKSGNSVTPTIAEYTVIHEREGGTNLMAHGYGLFGDFIVLVQHTSDRPITDDIAQHLAFVILPRIASRSAKENLVLTK